MKLSRTPFTALLLGLLLFSNAAPRLLADDANPAENQDTQSSLTEKSEQPSGQTPAAPPSAFTEIDAAPQAPGESESEDETSLNPNETTAADTTPAAAAESASAAELPTSPDEAPLRDLTAASSSEPLTHPAKKSPRASKTKRGNSNGLVTIGSSNNVTADGHFSEAVAIFGTNSILGSIDRDVVSIFGGNTITGTVGHDAVAVFGPNTISGKVGHDTVTVFGDLNVNGKVGGDAVCVFGKCTFGPEAEVTGKVVSVFGEVDRDPSAQLHQGIEAVASGKNLPLGIAALSTWLRECLGKGRLLAFSSGLGLLWLGAFGIVFLQVLIALLFRRSVDHCCELFEGAPGFSFLSALLAFFLTPIVIILLVVTGIGALLVPFIAIGLVLISIFGRVVIQASIGRLLARAFGTRQIHAALATLVGGVIVLLLLTIPIISLLTLSFIGFLGTGVVLYALLKYFRPSEDRRPPSPNAPSAGPVPPAAPINFVPAPSPAQSTVALATSQTPQFSSHVSSQVADSATQTSVIGTDSALMQANSESAAFTLPPMAFGTQSPTPPCFTPDLMETQNAPIAGPDLSGAFGAAQSQPTEAAASAPSTSNPSMSNTSTTAPLNYAYTGQTQSQALPPSVPLVSFPRAKFGIRMLALLIDFVLVAMISSFLSGLMPAFLAVSIGSGVFLLLAAYGALCWKYRGATIGDIILGLQVIRLDDRPLDWTTAIIRALGCLLSGFALGLGFIWIAIDRDSEAWHDKIAGTAVVRVPKSRPLV